MEQNEDKDDFNDLNKDMSGDGGEYDAEAQHSLPISERRKHKRLEVFVGGLDKDTTDEDLKTLFEQVGEVVEVRLMRNPQTGKNKGYAFIRYATTAMAKRAAEELEHVEVVLLLLAFILCCKELCVKPTLVLHVDSQ